jgi:hypothetical protein
LNQTTAGNTPGLVANPFNLRADKGLATFDVIAVIHALVALPFGKGRAWGNSLGGSRDRLVSGWSIASIVIAQSGFPFTPQLSYNPSNNGDTRNPVGAFVNPAFTRPVILGNPARGLIRMRF